MISYMYNISSISLVKSITVNGKPSQVLHHEKDNDLLFNGLNKIVSKQAVEEEVVYWLFKHLG